MFDILNKYNIGKKKLIGIGIFIILFLIALPLTLIQVQKQQNTKQRAEGANNVYLELKPLKDGKNAIDTQFVQTLYLKNPLNKDISAVDVSLAYNKDQLDVVDFIPENNLSYIVKDINIPGEVHLTGINSRQTHIIDSSIPLGAFILKAKKEGNGTIDFKNVLVTAANELQPLVVQNNRSGSYAIGQESVSITPTISISETPTPEPISCVQNSGICIPSYPCTLGYTPSSLSCESSAVCCVVSSPTPTTFSSPSTLPFPTPTRESTPIVIHGLEQGVSMEEDYIQQKLTSAVGRARSELELARVDIYKELTLDEIKQIAKEAIPYLAEELNIERVHVPPIVKGKINEYRYRRGLPFFNIFRIDRIEISEGPLFMKKTTVIHELVHAQRRIKPRAGNWAVSPSNEEFAETVAWAVLAKQALNGDLLAKYSLTIDVLCNLNVKRGKGESPACYGNSGYKPAILVMDALNGKSNSYGNVKLDGIVEFIKRYVLETNEN